MTDSGLVFHPLRNTFIHAAENAGILGNLARLIDGHSRTSQTFGGYSPGADMRVLQREVKKVTFGKLVDRQVERGISELTERKTRKPLVTTDGWSRCGAPQVANR